MSGEKAGDLAETVDRAGDPSDGGHRPSENGSHRHPRRRPPGPPETATRGARRNGALGAGRHDGRCREASVGLALRGAPRLPPPGEGQSGPGSSASAVGRVRTRSLAADLGPRGAERFAERLLGAPPRPASDGGGEPRLGPPQAVIDTSTARCVPFGTSCDGHHSAGRPRGLRTTCNRTHHRGGNDLVTTISGTEGAAIGQRPFVHVAIASVHPLMSAHRRAPSQVGRGAPSELREPTP